MKKATLSPALVRLKNETPGAYAAFLDYIALPAPRTIPALIDFYTDGGKSKKKPYSQDTLEGWQAQHEWKRREGEFVDELALDTQRRAKEYLARRGEKVMQQADRLVKQIDEMLDDFAKSKITRRNIVPDPRDDPNDPNARQMEIIHMKVNAHDLRVLAHTFGQINKDLKAIFAGDATQLSITASGQSKVKAYVTITDEEGNTFSGPDEWPEPGALEAAENAGADDSDDGA